MQTQLSVLAHGERGPKAQYATKAVYSSLFNNDENTALVACWALGTRSPCVSNPLHPPACVVCVC